MTNFKNYVDARNKQILEELIEDLQTDDEDTFGAMIKEECQAIQEMLLIKNKKYGNAALEPQRIFSSQNAVEQIKVRIDDKLSRIKNGGPENNQDTIKDLIGYLVLFRIAQKLNNNYDYVDDKKQLEDS